MWLPRQFFQGNEARAAKPLWEHKAFDDERRLSHSENKAFDGELRLSEGTEVVSHKHSHYTALRSVYSYIVG